MARLSLNKAQMARESSNLAMYRRFLPSLDLKRQQLMAASARKEAHCRELQRKLDALTESVGAEIPMLANREIDLSALVQLTAVHRNTENIAGQKVPVLERIETKKTRYGYLSRPHWVDLVATRLEEAIRLSAEIEIAHEALNTLNVAITRVTQRVNLFEKVLIPRAKNNMRRISIALGDMERAAVVNSKIAKKKRALSDA